jgi:hypothetical protein
MCSLRAFKKRLTESLSRRLRGRKLAPVAESLESGMTVLDIGVWSKMPEPHPSENWLEKQNPGQGKLIAVGLNTMSNFHEKYRHVLCVQANGCRLPFKSGSVDVAVANAVLEHVAASEQQMFTQEIARVARKWSLLSVPDRWSPMEVHSRVIFFHWFPNWRGLFRRTGQAYWASEDNLTTVFTKQSLRALLERSSFDSGAWTIERQCAMGVPVSLLARFHRFSEEES